MEINANLIPTLILLSFFHLSFVCCRKSVNGFTLDLIHNDSPRSPFHNPSSTPYERFQNAFHRSLSRASFFNKIGVNSIQSTVIPTRGEFLMKISVGTPPVDTLVIVDTGSDLTWTQCKPCVKCFKQVIPIFNPKSSSSYKTVSCTDKLCREVSKPIKCTKNVCNYVVNYGDQSHTSGDLSIETFRFASTSGKDVSIPNIVFGCGHQNAGTFNNATSGIIGLGGGNVSIVNQMHQEIKGKFSYCLIPLAISSSNPNVTSHINFGDNAIVSGPGVVSTPLFRNPMQPTFYFLNLKAVSVGSNRVKYQSSPISPPAGDGDHGNIIIDSGTVLTFIPDAFYLNLGSLLMRSVNATRKDDPSGTFTVCYEPNENGTINVPKIVAHFTDADLELSPTSVFAKVADDLVCLTIVPGNQVAIFGNLLQSNFLIGYDLVANKVSFKPTDCTKQ
ncbi:putative aspartic proteinase CDR1-like [Capsicum annuum]|uniref:aspartic proteinase CDR1-like n=1 Tax=Capsicum annuum TaxID=4072 RepID=UPI001FB0C227|nr:aspartic proteinase CDR1-like [Capsicum annuum]KAF3680796.1 putative aspartic proteinase CDR1-like [Capsicum annuum]